MVYEMKLITDSIVEATARELSPGSFDDDAHEHFRQAAFSHAKAVLMVTAPLLVRQCQTEALTAIRATEAAVYPSPFYSTDEKHALRHVLELMRQDINNRFSALADQCPSPTRKSRWEAQPVKLSAKDAREIAGQVIRKHPLRGSTWSNPMIEACLPFGMRLRAGAQYEGLSTLNGLARFIMTNVVAL